MTYEEARNSGVPFNRRKYKDDWYIFDKKRNIDYSKIDLSQRFWSKEDLEANDWWTARDGLEEAISALLQDRGWD